VIINDFYQNSDNTAAGRGSRLKDKLLKKPKPMTHVNNITIIDNLIYELHKSEDKKYRSSYRLYVAKAGKTSSSLS